MAEFFRRNSLLKTKRGQVTVFESENDVQSDKKEFLKVAINVTS